MMRVLFAFVLSVSVLLFASVTMCSADQVSVFVCNAYPAQYISFQVSFVNSSRVAYKECASILVDNTVPGVEDKAWLWSNVTVDTPSSTTTFRPYGTWCFDFNRNIIVAYEAAGGGVAFTFPALLDGGIGQNCSALSGTAVRYFFNAACSIASANTVDVLFNGVVLKSSLTCAKEQNYFALIASPASFTSGNYTFNSPGNSTAVAGPFTLPATLTSLAADQFELLFISGDNNNKLSAWTYISAVTPTPTPGPATSAACHSAYKFPIQNFVVVAAAIASAIAFAKF